MEHINMDRSSLTSRERDCRDAGERTVMLIHGMWSRPQVWANFRAYFEARGYDVVTPRLRHHDIEPGEAADPALATTSVVDYAADLETEIRALGTRPFLIGHSMGGLLAQMLAARGLAKGAVLLASAHPAPVFAFEMGVVRIFLRDLVPGPIWKHTQLPTYSAMRWGALNRFDEKTARELYATLIPESGRCFLEIALWYLDRRRASFVDAAKVACPLLFMTGADDRLIRAALAARAALYYGGKARFERLPGHAHWLPGEPGWEEIAAKAARFFEEEVPLFKMEAALPAGAGFLLQPA